MKFIKNIQAKIANLPVLKELIDWSKMNSLPGFLRVPIYDVLTFLINEVRQENLITRANSIAFSVFLSLFPTLLAFFTLIPIILPLFSDIILPLVNPELVVVETNGVVNFQKTLLAQFSDILYEIPVIPTSVHSQLTNFMSNILLEPRFGLLSFGFVLALFFATNGMNTLMRGFEKSHPTTFKKRNILEKRWIALKLVLLMGTLVASSVLFIILGNSFISWLFGFINASGLAAFFITFLRFVIMFLLFYFGITFLYRWGAPTLRKFNFFSPGAMLSTILSLITSWGFALYVNNYSLYNELYGSIGTIIVTMLWIQINAFILLVGFELNAAIAVNRDLKKVLAKQKEELEEENQ